jgi:hypothetical protein
VRVKAAGRGARGSDRGDGDTSAERGERGKYGDTPATMKARVLARSARRAPAEQVPAARPGQMGYWQFVGHGQFRHISDSDTTARSEKRISIMIWNEQGLRPAVDRSVR